jgi:hypothetical protein
MDHLPAREGEAYERMLFRGGSTSKREASGNLREVVVHSLLPTPAVMDMGSNYTPEQWQAWKDKQRAAHNNGNGHGASLTQEALTFGASTPLQLDAGS